MNKPAYPPVPDDDVGPLDEQGRQIWSPEEDEAVARIMAESDFWPSIARGQAQFSRGECRTTEEVFAELEQRRQARRGHA